MAPRRRSKHGFTLIEMLAGVVLLGWLIIKVMPIIHDYQRTIALRGAAYEQTAVGAALMSYIQANENTLAQILAGNTSLTVSCGPANCANPLQPTPAEMVASGYTSVPLNAQLGGTYALTVSQTASGNIEAAVARTVPVTVPGSAVLSGTDLTVMANYEMSSSPLFSNNVGWSTAATPGVITGPQNAWTRTNPMGSTAGIVMAIAQYNSSAMAAYCQQGGTCNVNSLTATNLTATNGTVTTLASTTATANSLSGQTLSYQGGTITTLSGTTATIPTITGTLNGNATSATTAQTANTANSATTASSANSVPCSGITGANVNLCNGVTAN